MKKSVDEALAREFGLTSEEYARVVAIMGRTPSLTELGVFSVMWSEHCSYKSSRKWLKTLPTTAPWVIHGPGENAGVVDIGEGYAAIFKMESHNHPSFIEPYQGAATGVGGILRDVFTMGARPVANLNALRFGSPETPRTRQIIDGVVRGIGGYGNCVGVPTVGGEINFHPAYDGNPLVNAMTVGIARKDRIFLSAAAGIGNPVVYVGSRTGRDGIHGATMSSAEFDEHALAKRPTVQVGDPFIEKLLIEACLELMATDAIVAIQDMGAAGLTSSSVEMAGKGGVGIELDLDAVPQREPGMTAYEMMLSESQERMLMVLKPDRTEIARKIFEKWELDFAIIGHLTDTGHIVVKHKGQVEADIPLDPLAEQAPIYDRPAATPVVPGPVEDIHAPLSLDAMLLKLVGSPDLASRAWVWNQYDSTVGGQTVRRPGAADAAIVKIEDTSLGLALTTDCTPRYCQADPKTGGAQAVAEAWRNITATGARPLAVTDNLNFGNPEKPEIMGQFVAAIEGMGEACRVLDFPVVSGNVSLYNETRQPDGSTRAILPTPAIGALGVLEDVTKAVGLGMAEASDLVLVGETKGELGQSIWLREILGREEGAPPSVDLATEKRNGDFVRNAILDGTVRACHDIADGGILVAVAEMVMASRVGCELESPTSGIRPEAFWFGEDQARYLVCVKDGAAFCADAQKNGVPARILGRSGGSDLILPSGVTISAARLTTAHDAFFPTLMAR
ncbi:phosphoribosylformylglycinamidine synthase subunit PurL [Acetobacter orientalis]|uniref:Phosphoribosylformylglycinamidine synthase subunit PurL n=1 Tax=Acetobacter orientalis TaxID=146474 RepID=A0A2Z5ZDH4_9PROT|nr:phosphoribosylformylglycinamidine synthase subunit PurL [Acetobacter orientalis]BBC78633.1 phosphoribosylformylglycinamidine synthase II [Acetobacter orientalis]GAN66752.1 phosphoribosylformylglycinamidine synthase II [Acetobacter orientalis]GBR13886.1 phosphoribosylformylglycinamidine synthase II [Acetobacter orientalis NRIC 0481]GEL60750.1 phosphoribosylformylglycinamidine synthase subunit PurL [Acetobacter orientalis]